MKRRRERPIRTVGLGRKSATYTNSTFAAKLSTNVTSEELFLIALEMPAVWEAVNKRGFSVNKVLKHGQRLRLIEPDIESQKFLISMEGQKYRFDLFEFAAGARLLPAQEHVGEVWPCRLEVVSPRTHESIKMVEEFEWLINKPDIAEYDIQRFLEEHPNLLLGIEHKRIHSQLTLVREDQSDLRPDFFLEKLEGRWCDILDLKLPSERLVVHAQPGRKHAKEILSQPLDERLGRIK